MLLDPPSEILHSLVLHCVAFEKEVFENNPMLGFTGRGTLSLKITSLYRHTSFAATMTTIMHLTAKQYNDASQH